MEHMMGDNILIKVDNEGNIMGKVNMLQITTISPFFVTEMLLNHPNRTYDGWWHQWHLIKVDNINNHMGILYKSMFPNNNLLFIFHNLSLMMLESHLANLRTPLLTFISNYSLIIKLQRNNECSYLNHGNHPLDKCDTEIWNMLFSCHHSIMSLWMIISISC